MLIVDDDPTSLEDAGELLRLFGIAPMQATDGTEAVALARAHEFDLILMDLQMPVLGGLGATKQIRLHEQTRPFPSNGIGLHHPRAASRFVAGLRHRRRARKAVQRDGA